jgi:hypothetical protein
MKAAAVVVGEIFATRASTWEVEVGLQAADCRERELS